MAARAATQLNATTEQWIVYIREDIALSLDEIFHAPHCIVVGRMWNPVAFVMRTSTEWSTLS